MRLPCLEVQRWASIYFYLYLYRLLCLESHIIYIGIVFKKCRFDLSEIPLVFFLYFNLTAYHRKGVDDSREVFCKIEIVILRKQ